MAKKKRSAESDDGMNSFKMKLEFRKPADLVPYARNAKKHPPDQVKSVSRQIWKYGFDQPIVIDENNCILKGHGRVQAATELGLKEVPVVVRSGMSETEKKAIRLADNKVAESEWDKAMLAFELNTLVSEEGFNIEDTGFSADAVDKLLSEGEISPTPQSSGDLESKFEVIIECANEDEQKTAYDSISEMGYKCRVLSM